MTYITEHIFVFEDKAKSIQAMNKVIQFKHDHLRTHIIDILRFMNRRVEFYVYQMKRRLPKPNIDFLAEFPNDSYYFNKYRYKMSMFIQNLQNVSYQLNLDLQYKVITIWRSLVPREHLVEVIAYRHLLKNYIQYIHRWHLYCKTRKQYMRYWFIKWGQYTLVNVGNYQEQHFVSKLERRGLLNHNFQKWKRALATQNFINQSFYLKLYYDFNQLRAKELTGTNGLLSYIIFFFMQFNNETRCFATAIKCLKHWRRIGQTRQQYLKFVQLIQCRHLCTVGKTCIRLWRRLIQYKQQSKGNINRDENGDAALPLEIIQKIEQTTIDLMFSQEEINYDCDVATKRPDLAFIQMQERQNIDETNSFLLYKLKQLILAQDKKLNINQGLNIVMFDSYNTRFVDIFIKSIAILQKTRKAYMRQAQKNVERKFQSLGDTHHKLTLLENIEAEHDRYVQYLKKTEEQMAVRYIDFGIAVEKLMENKLGKLKQLHPQITLPEPFSGARSDVLRSISRKYPTYEKYAGSIQGAKMSLIYEAMNSKSPALLKAGNLQLNSASFIILCQLVAAQAHQNDTPNKQEENQQKKDDNSPQTDTNAIQLDESPKNSGIGPIVAKIVDHSTYHIQLSIARDYAKDGTAALPWPEIMTEKTTQMAAENLKYRQRAGIKQKFRIPLQYDSWIAAWLLLATQRESDQVTRIRHDFMKAAARRIRLHRGESATDALAFNFDSRATSVHGASISLPGSSQGIRHGTSGEIPPGSSLQEIYDALGVIDNDEAKDTPSQEQLRSATTALQLLKNALNLTQDTTALLSRKKVQTTEFQGYNLDDFLFEPKTGSIPPALEETVDEKKKGDKKSSTRQKKQKNKLSVSGASVNEENDDDSLSIGTSLDDMDGVGTNTRSISQETRNTGTRGTSNVDSRYQKGTRSSSEVVESRKQGYTKGDEQKTKVNKQQADQKDFKDSKGSKSSKVGKDGKYTKDNKSKDIKKPPKLLKNQNASKTSLPTQGQFGDSDYTGSDDDGEAIGVSGVPGASGPKGAGKNATKSPDGKKGQIITQSSKENGQKPGQGNAAASGTKGSPKSPGQVPTPSPALPQKKVLSKMEKEAMKYKEDGDVLDNVHEIVNEDGQKVFIQINADGTRTLLDKDQVSNLKRKRADQERRRQALERSKKASQKAAQAESIEEYFQALLEGAATEEEIERIRNFYQQAQAAGLTLEQLRGLAARAAEALAAPGGEGSSSPGRGDSRGHQGLADILIANAAGEVTNAEDTGAGRALYDRGAFEKLLGKQQNAVKKIAAQAKELRRILYAVNKADRQLIGVKVDDLSDVVLRRICERQVSAASTGSPQLTRTYRSTAMQIFIDQLIDDEEALEKQKENKKITNFTHTTSKQKVHTPNHPIRKLIPDDLLLMNSYTFASFLDQKEAVKSDFGQKSGESLLLKQSHRFQFRKQHLVARRSRSMPTLSGPLNFTWLDRLRPKTAAVLNPATAEKKYKLKGVNRAQQVIDSITSVQLSNIQAGRTESPAFAKRDEQVEPVEFTRIDDVFQSNYFAITNGNFSFEVPVLTKKQQKMIRRFKSDDDVDIEINDFSDNEIDEYDSLFNQDSRMNLEKLITMRKNDLQKALQLEMQHDEVARKLYIYKTGGATNIEDMSADDLDAIRKYNQMLLQEQEEKEKQKAISKSKIKKPTFKQTLENEKLLFSEKLFRIKQEEEIAEKQRKIDALFTKQSTIADRMPIVDKSQVKQYSWQLGSTERTLYQITNRSQKDGSKIIRRVLNPVPTSVIPRMDQYINDLEDREYQLQEDRKLVQRLLKAQNEQ